MTNKEREAIERLERGTTDSYIIIKKDVKTLLNLIQTQQAEIEDLQKSVDQIYEDYQDIGKEMFKCNEELEKKDKIINSAINEIEILRQDFSEDLQPDFIRILEILKDKKVIDW